MTFGICQCALFRVYSNAHALSAQQYLGLKLNGIRAGGIKFELAIPNQKLLNGTLDVASTLPYPELRTHLLNLKFEHWNQSIRVCVN